MNSVQGIDTRWWTLKLVHYVVERIQTWYRSEGKRKSWMGTLISTLQSFIWYIGIRMKYPNENRKRQNHIYLNWDTLRVPLYPLDGFICTVEQISNSLRFAVSLSYVCLSLNDSTVWSCTNWTAI